MDPMTLAVAGVAALAVILIAFGIASSGNSGISDRLERYAPDAATAQYSTMARARQGQDRPEHAIANLNKVSRPRLRRQPRP